MNWLTTLAKLAVSKSITILKYQRLLDLASKWPTCACGQLCKKLPRDEDGKPEDTLLSALGHDFVNNISRKEWVKALKTFKKIERRSTLLLKKQHGNKPKRQK